MREKRWPKQAVEQAHYLLENKRIENRLYAVTEPQTSGIVFVNITITPNHSNTLFNICFYLSMLVPHRNYEQLGVYFHSNPGFLSHVK